MRKTMISKLDALDPGGYMRLEKQVPDSLQVLLRDYLEGL